MRLHRLSFTDAWPAQGKVPNPFEQLATPPTPGERLSLCLHTNRLTDLDDEQELISEQLTAPHRRNAIRIFRTPGEPSPRWAPVPDFRLSAPASNDQPPSWIMLEGSKHNSRLPKTPEDILAVSKQWFGTSEFVRETQEILAV